MGSISVKSVSGSPDTLDRQILSQLQKNSRQSITAIAEICHAPRATVHQRIRKMEESGIIIGYGVRLNHQKLGQGLTGFIQLSFTPSKDLSQTQVASLIEHLPGVAEVHTVTGQYDFLIKVRAASMDEIGSLIVEKLRMIPGVGSTLTSIAFWAHSEET